LSSARAGVAASSVSAEAAMASGRAPFTLFKAAAEYIDSLGSGA
jgi:hypothetical protein